ncbi:hypothetical protein HZC32_01085 [Candidatus Woesearchaeota archaeon]|nr:hypothetical protein [Candidatus Woesearchaeota archaeon]
MISKKRGIMWIVVAVVIISSFSVMAQLESMEFVNDEVPFVYAGLMVGDSDDKCSDAKPIYIDTYPADKGFGMKNLHPVDAPYPSCTMGGYFSIYTANGIHLSVIAGAINDNLDTDDSFLLKCPNPNDDKEECHWNEQLSEQGCYLFALEEDGNDPDDCAGTLVEAGTVLGHTPLVIITEGETQTSPAEGEEPIKSAAVGTLINPNEGPDGGDATLSLFNCNNAPVQTTPQRSLLCGDKNIQYSDKKGKQVTSPLKVWLECNAEYVNKYAYANLSTGESDVYQCKYLQSQGYEWINLGVLNCDLINCDNNKEVCEKDGYNWMDDAKENNCCGDDGIEDLDTEVKTKADNYRCLISIKELVGTPWANAKQFGWGAFEETPSEGTSAQTGCEGEWCWIPAIGDPAFKIYTIKKPGEKPYDLVSNNEKWFGCKSGQEGPLPPPAFSQSWAQANQFYCYNAGDQWSWVQCCGSGTCLEQGEPNGIKVRNPGDGTYTLASNMNDNSIEFKNNGYGVLYNNDYPDFTGYDFLEMYITFTAEKVIKPTKVMVEVLGVDDGKLFSGDALSYVVNGARLEPGKQMHVKIPVGNWANVEGMNIYPDPIGNTLTIAHVQLTKKDGNNPICSGEKEAGIGSWLFDLDSFKEGELSGEQMCTALGMTWLGPVEEEQYMCCGDDGNEYYIPEEEVYSKAKKPLACWNSEGVEENKPLMNVEVELSYGLGEWSLSYPEETVNGSVEIVKEVENLIGLEGDYIYKCPDKSSQTGAKVCSNECTSQKIFSGKPGMCTLSYIPYGTTEAFTPLGAKVPATCGDAFTSPAGVTTTLFPCEDGPYVNGELVSGIETVKEETNSYGPFSEKATVLTSPVKLGEFTVAKERFVSAKFKPTVGNVYLINPLYPEDELDKIDLEDLERNQNTFYVMGKVDAIQREYNYSYKKENITFTCFSDTCSMPLKGNPPYVIKNVHPEKYDLYYVNKVGNKEIRLFVDKEKKVYSREGWLEVKNVPAQILFTGNAFVSCGSEDYQLGDANVLGAPFCNVTANYFCAPEKGWSKQSLPKYIFDENNVLMLATPATEIKATERNTSTSVIYGRNLLLNPWLSMDKKLKLGEEPKVAESSSETNNNGVKENEAGS